MTDNTSTLNSVTSKDGTTIAYDRLGEGPAIVLVSGGSVDRQSNAGLASVLASRFTVYNYDRRGRGPSGDTQPYAIEREIEDIDAVIQAAGGSAHLYGSSSGAALALMAAKALPGRVRKLALWEPPFIADPNARPPRDTVQQYERMVGEGRRGDAVEYFMTQVVRLPADFAAFARTQPWWADQEKIAHTLAYDGRIMGDYSLPLETAAAVAVPTIVLAGSASMPFMSETANELAGVLPNGQARILDGQEHNVDPTVIGPALAAFLAD
ncbi:MAG TPA: alpha/beta hydrolase [Candidatus Limnocylindrales bacterium]|jgi:pimeloyl-ACP methyl ester carboxylesterase